MDDHLDNRGREAHDRVHRRAQFRADMGEERYARSKFELAARLFDEIIANDTLEEFLTLKAYTHLD